MQRYRHSSRASAAGALLLGALLVMSGPAVAVPPPPPNPSEDELRDSRERAQSKAGEVGQLTSELAGAEAQLAELKAKVGRKLELAKKAMIDLGRARDAAERAEQAADDAQAAVRAASERIKRARANLDELVASSYQHGSMVDSVTAYLGSDGPEDVLARAQLLSSVADERLNALESMRRAKTAKANKEAAAREALRSAREKREAAEQAKQQADAAKAAAVEAREQQASQIAELQTTKESILHELYNARQKVDSLESKRETYQDWLARKRAEERRRQQAAAAAAAASASSGSDSGSSSGSGSGSNASANSTSNGGGSVNTAAPAPSSSIETVIARAKSQLGVTYAWGGGNAYGPTYGIRDGGVADAHGDWKKIGFDCSGLMTYAFAPVKTMPSYSGYQYNAGTKVPVSQARRGDMLFWGPGGGTHVALYLGNGMMLEAPYSGGQVRIAPVRWGGIAPYAVRIV